MCRSFRFYFILFFWNAEALDWKSYKHTNVIIILFFLFVCDVKSTRKKFIYIFIFFLLLIPTLRNSQGMLLHFLFLFFFYVKTFSCAYLPTIMYEAIPAVWIMKVGWPTLPKRRKTLDILKFIYLIKMNYLSAKEPRQSSHTLIKILFLRLDVLSSNYVIFFDVKKKKSKMPLILIY